ncbi:hypothetical protein AFV1_ORF144 [Captovirus AFV1]|uniref:Uncharacterized protein ORF144 n=1 Tax=Acidianus filamentous virus 1 (isolate United States/Yellowstone) TaxID=654909 RepID=Y144_AFV1Y|nr:hypothetical protein AFV1_ORF144 [Captovirus AFV1]Q70LD9.1 RecName: Full=Uncharacterized protein ORF144 [Acidianus filamentous virus 1 (isolate Yellowstone)]CAD98941.1 hypothetical protein [Captovirus AFV1]
MTIVNILRVDIDQPFDYLDKQFYGNLTLRKLLVWRIFYVSKVFSQHVESLEFRKSLSGNIHVLVTINPGIQRTLVPLAQFLMGDDIMRTFMNLKRKGKGNYLFSYGNTDADRFLAERQIARKQKALNRKKSKTKNGEKNGEGKS